jgi:hypothetical protein
MYICMKQCVLDVNYHPYGLYHRFGQSEGYNKNVGSKEVFNNNKRVEKLLLTPLSLPAFIFTNINTNVKVVKDLLVGTWNVHHHHNELINMIQKILKPIITPSLFNL